MKSSDILPDKHKISLGTYNNCRKLLTIKKMGSHLSCWFSKEDWHGEKIANRFIFSGNDRAREDSRDI